MTGGLSPLALFRRHWNISVSPEKELKQWLNPWRGIPYNSIRDLREQLHTFTIV
jgi:hypothetical protein